MNASLEKKRLGQNPERFLNYARQRIIGVQTGLGRFDSQIHGLRGLVGLVGEPAACKSTLALQMALHHASQGDPVLFVDLENGQSLTSQRILCNVHNESWNTIRVLKDETLIKLYTGLERLPFYYADSSPGFDDIAKQVEEIAMSYKDKKILLVVDSLQAIQLNLRDLRLSIDEWLVGLDRLKLQYDPNLTVLMTCEKRRGTYGMASKDSAKETGRIEYKSEILLDIRMENEEIILECTKNRHGPTPLPTRLEKVMSDSNDPFSFTFKLKEREAADL